MFITNYLPINESVYFEAELSTEDRKKLKTKTFGLPKQRKYPLNDARHVISAIAYFNKCSEEDERELAANINKAIKKFNLHPTVSEKNRFSKCRKSHRHKA